MTRKICLKEKTISETGKLPQIVKFLEDALGTYGLNENLVNSEAKLCPGLWNSLVIIKVEGVTGKALGGKERVMPKCIFPMDFFAEDLFYAYKLYLRQLLDEGNIDIDDAVADNIKNPYVLIQEILLRLFAYCLSADKTDLNGRSNKILIKVIEEFLKLLLSHGLLTETSFFGNKSISSLGKGIADSTDFSGLLYNCVMLTEDIHANRRAIEECIQFTKEAERIIKCQLVAYLNPGEKNKNLLLEDEVSFSLKKLEKKLCIEFEKKANSNSDSLNFAPLQISHPQIKPLVIILQKFEKKMPYAKQLQQRYELLNKIYDLQEILNRVDTLSDIMGWLPIITGVYNLDSLIKAIENIYNECQQTLNLESSVNKDTKFEKSNMYTILREMSAHKATILHNVALRSVKTLIKIQQPEVIMNLMNYANQQLSDLFQFQQQTGIEVISPAIQKQFLPTITFEEKPIDISPLEGVQQTVSAITTRFQQLLQNCSLERSDNRTRVVFNNPQSVKDFQQELFKIGIENRGMKGALRKIEILIPDKEHSQERYAIDLTSDEWNAIEKLVLSHERLMPMTQLNEHPRPLDDHRTIEEIEESIHKLESALKSTYPVRKTPSIKPSFI